MRGAAHPAGRLPERPGRADPLCRLVGNVYSLKTEDSCWQDGARGLVRMLQGCYMVNIYLIWSALHRGLHTGDGFRRGKGEAEGWVAPFSPQNTPVTSPGGAAQALGGSFPPRLWAGLVLAREPEADHLPSACPQSCKALPWGPQGSCVRSGLGGPVPGPLAPGGRGRVPPASLQMLPAGPATQTSSPPVARRH